MMKNFIRSIALLCTFASSAVYAFPLTEADAFATGDHKAAYETSTGLTWLDLDVTAGKTFTQVFNELSTTYTGWRLPTETEVRHLLLDIVPDASWLPDSPYLRELTNKIVYWKDMYSIWGSTQHEGTVVDNADSPWATSSRLIFMGDDATLDAVGLGEFLDLTSDTSPIHDVSFWHATDSVAFSDGYTTLLVKDTATTQVPESSSLSLLMIGLLGVVIIRRQGTK